MPDTSGLMNDHVIPSDPVRPSPNCEQSKLPRVQSPSRTVLPRNTGEEPVKTTVTRRGRTVRRPQYLKDYILNN